MGKTAFEISTFLGSTAYTGHSLSNSSTAYEVAIALGVVLVGCCPMIIRWADTLGCWGEADTPGAGTSNADTPNEVVA